MRPQALILSICKSRGKPSSRWINVAPRTMHFLDASPLMVRPRDHTTILIANPLGAQPLSLILQG
jgi:hypothetical protein